MALQCQMSVNVFSSVAGQTPVPQATLTVYNPNASAVVVTGAQVTIRSLSGQFTAPANIPLVPLTPGTTSVAALSTATFGPFGIAIGTPSNVNSFQAVNPAATDFDPVYPQQAVRSPRKYFIGATVYGSDGSLNVAGEAPVLIDTTTPPPLGYQGGFLQFSSPNNFAAGFLAGIF